MQRKAREGRAALVGRLYDEHGACGFDARVAYLTEMMGGGDDARRIAIMTVTEEEIRMRVLSGQAPAEAPR